MPRSRLRSAATFLLALAASGLVGLVVFVATILLIPPNEPKPSWTPTSGKPPPEDFMVAMFPTTEFAPLRETASPTALSTSVLERALVNTLIESKLSATEWIAVQQPKQVLWVQRSDLSFIAPPDADQKALFDAYIANDDKRHPSQFHHGNLTSSPQPDGSIRFTLRLADDDHEQKFVYDVKGDTVTPIAEYRVVGAASGLMNLHIFVIGAAAAVIASTLVLVAYFALRRRRAGHGK